MKESAEHRLAVEEFAERWKDRGDEKQDTQSFWIDLLTNILGVENATSKIDFEVRVKLDNVSYIDAYLPETKVLIEQKGQKVNLLHGIKQSDGSILSPFQQARRYAANLPHNENPRWICISNFQEFWVYDMNRPNDEPEKILLKDLRKEYHRLAFLADTGDVNLKREMEISIKAGEIVGKLYDALLSQYKDPNSEKTLKSLNALCVRLVFCFYAEDTSLFGRRLIFHDYLSKHRLDARRALIDLFKVLNTPETDRDPYLDDDIASFPYVNGGLFANDDIEIPRLTPEILDLILENASAEFDWSGISPTIFGALFESTLNPETRRSGGMHYTSIENIHKVIDPLFLDELKQELAKVKEIKALGNRKKALKAYQDKLASLTFFDPACGSGNFLTESYVSLRRLENEVLTELLGDQIELGFEGTDSLIKVSIGQFYGIEINDFAVTVAKTALWIAEAQMMEETETIIHTPLNMLPLRSYANITEGNALRIDWESVVPKERLNYIMGNPPFVGARLMSPEQKKDVLTIFGKNWKNVGNLDYVACWYKKACDLMKDTDIRSALVSTNSITQGEQVPILWKPLFEMGVHIDFAHRTFRWNSEAKIKAHVHCVIVGFSLDSNSKPILLFTDGRYQQVKHINAYLTEGEDIFVESFKQSISREAPEARSGNQPIDGGNYLFTQAEYEEFIAKEPHSRIYFHRWYGAEEYINNKVRYCLWLGDCSPAELRKMPECLKRVEAVRNFRLSSSRSSTIKLSEKPTRFQVETFPTSTYIVMPLTSSERRRYVPLGFMSPNDMASNLVVVVMDVNLYHFGVLTSNVFMSWMRAVGGRLKSDYRITKDNVYNNFPWPENITDKVKEEIEKTAWGILDTRAKYPDCSLADLYDEVTMPPELRTAHQKNDIAVMKAYGFPLSMTESECVGELMKMYKDLVDSEDKLKTAEQANKKTKRKKS